MKPSLPRSELCSLKGMAILEAVALAKFYGSGELQFFCRGFFGLRQFRSQMLDMDKQLIFEEESSSPSEAQLQEMRFCSCL